jgi:hypothetical protein
MLREPRYFQGTFIGSNQCLEVSETRMDGHERQSSTAIHSNGNPNGISGCGRIVLVLFQTSMPFFRALIN